MWRVGQIIITIILGCSYNLSANRPYTPEFLDPLTQSWRWKQFPELEGKGIRCIFEESKEKIWIAGNYGIYEYNGYTWYLHDHKTGLDTLPIDQVLGNPERNGLCRLCKRNTCPKRINLGKGVRLAPGCPFSL